MAIVSDYVVTGGTATLEIGGDIDETFTFSIPANVNLNRNAVATWRFNAENSPNNLAWNLKINGTQIISFTHDQDQFCALQEPFAGSLLQVGDNDATMRVTGGTGRIKVEAIIIHYKVDV